MGRRNRRRERNGGEEQKGSGSATGAPKADQPRATRPEHYEEILRENEAFVLYYKAQKVIPEEEWDLFMRTLATNLPVSFRITGFRSEASLLRSIIKTKYFQGLKRIPRVGDEEEVEVVPVALPWYPEELAWQVNLTRQMIRRNEELAKFHHFLISETVCGAISRQEAVSMIPPVVMDVKPHHKVLDMCAAPGSKTTQLLEMLHADESKMPEGLVVANDADNKRCYMLVTQSKRLNSPSLIIINHDASNLPSMTETSADGTKVPLKFDRVLCDVPCSGDGTMRKNIDVWKKWNGANGNNLHWLQFRIARRGLELLKTDGLMVYSTCSLNPVEDEAVLCRLMREYPGCIELVDVSHRVPGLKYSPGVTVWKPMSRDMKFYDKAEDVPEKFASQIRAPMFPPTEEEAKEFHLERCMRILPHHQDTGGFFVAAIRKLGPLKKANPEGSNGSTNGEKKDAAKNGGTTEAGGKEDSAEDEEKMQPPKKRRFFGYREDPFLYFNEDEPIWGPIRDSFGLEGIDPTILLSRNRVGKKNTIYLTSASVKDFIVNNEDKVKVINTGIKAFIRTDGKNSDCEYRLAQEGASEMLRFVKKRVVNMKQEDALAILQKHDLEDPLQNSQLCPETQEQLKGINTGSIVLLHETEIPETKKKLTLVMVGWKGATTIRAYVAKNDRVHLLRLSGGDTTYFENLDIEAKFRNKGAGDRDGGDVETKTSKGVENDEQKESEPSTGEANGDAMESSESKKERVENSAV